jgi:hypothetical protein
LGSVTFSSAPMMPPTLLADESVPLDADESLIRLVAAQVAELRIFERHRKGHGVHEGPEERGMAAGLFAQPFSLRVALDPVEGKRDVHRHLFRQCDFALAKAPRIRHA